MTISNLLSSIIKSNSFGLVEITTKLVNWISLPIAGLLLEPEVFGYIVLTYASISMVTSIGIFGQQRVLLSSSIRSSHHISVTLTNSILLSFAATATTYMVIACIDDQKSISVIFISATLAIHTLLTTQMRGLGLLKEFLLLRTSLVALRFLLIVSSALIFSNLASYLYAEIVSLILSLVLFTSRPIARSISPKNIDARTIITSAKIGFPVFLQTISTMIIVNYDKILMSASRSMEEVGKYGLLFMISSSISFMASYTAIKYEILIYQSPNKEAALHSTRKYAANLILLQALVSAIILVTVEILSTFSDKIQSIEFIPLILLLVGQVALSGSTPWSSYLTRRKRFKTQFFGAFMSATVSVTLNINLIPKFGAVGASLSFLIASALYLFINVSTSIREGATKSR